MSQHSKEALAANSKEHVEKAITTGQKHSFAKAPSQKVGAIQKLVAQLTTTEPYNHNGFVWAKRPQAWWVSTLGFSVETFRRLISKPPFVRECVLDPETSKKVTLIREGVYGAKTKKHVQNILAKIWLSKTGRRINGAQYGQLGGLADEWGLEKAPEIFKLVLNDVPAFMAGAKIQIALLGDEGYFRYYDDFPPTSFILRFNSVGKEMHLMKQQNAYSAKSSQKALSPLTHIK